MANQPQQPQMMMNVDIPEEEAVAATGTGWKQARTHLTALHAIRTMQKAREAAVAKPYVRQDSITEISSPWRQSREGHKSPVNWNAPPPHAAGCACCQPGLSLVEPVKKTCFKSPADDKDRRAAVLHRWHLPLLALRAQRLNPLKIASEEDLELPLPLLQLKFEHPHLLFFLTDGLFTVLEDCLLDIRLLVKDAQLIVLVDQLNTHVVSGLTSRFILEDE